MERLSYNFSGRARREKLHNRDYLVVPLTLIVPGVLNGSRGPLLYPPSEVKKNYSGWNGMPLVANHPESDEGHLSGRDPSVLNESGLGYVYHTRFDGTLKAEGWFDVENVKKVDYRIYDALTSGRKIELSTGLFTDNEPSSPGSTYNGKPYYWIARNYRPDHVAVLYDQVGACSINDGCGVNVNSCSNCTPDDPCEECRTKNANPEGCNQYKSCGGGGGSYKELSKGAEAASKAAREISTRQDRMTGGDPTKASSATLARIAGAHEQAAAAHADAYGHKDASSKGLSKHESEREYHTKEAATYKKWAERAKEREAGEKPDSTGSAVQRLGPKEQLGNPARGDVDISVASAKAEQFARDMVERFGIRAVVDGGSSGEFGTKIRFFNPGGTVDGKKIFEAGEQHMTKTARDMHDLWTSNEGGGEWITISGTHVKIDKEGNITSGPKRLKESSGGEKSHIRSTQSDKASQKRGFKSEQDEQRFKEASRRQDTKEAKEDIGRHTSEKLDKVRKELFGKGKTERREESVKKGLLHPGGKKLTAKGIGHLVSKIGSWSKVLATTIGTGMLGKDDFEAIKGIPADIRDRFSKRFGKQTHNTRWEFDAMTLNILADMGLAANAFCATGPGGGQDNSCSSRGGGGRDSGDAAFESSGNAADSSKAAYDVTPGTAGGAQSIARQAKRSADQAAQMASVGDYEQAAEFHGKAADQHDRVASLKTQTEGVRRIHREAAEEHRKAARRNKDAAGGETSLESIANDPKVGKAFRMAARSELGRRTGNAEETCNADDPEGDCYVENPGTVRNRELAKHTIWNKIGEALGFTHPVKEEPEEPYTVNEYEKSFNDRSAELSNQLQERFGKKGPESLGTFYVVDLYDDHVIYQLNGDYYKLGYTEEDGECVLSDEKPQRVDRVTYYEPAHNAFCPTGPGGGQDNSCSSRGGGGRAQEEAARAVEKADAAGRSLSKKYSPRGKGGYSRYVQEATKEEHARIAELEERAASAFRNAARAAKDSGASEKEVESLEDDADRYQSSARISRRYSQQEPGKRGVENAAINQPKSSASGRYKRLNAGTGKGDAHEAAQRGAVYLTSDDYAHGALAKSEADAGHNPASWVEDEDTWERAKKAADKGDYDGDTYWAVVSHIYQQMGGSTKSGTKNELARGYALTAADRNGEGVFNEEEDDMSLSVRERTGMVSALIANCSCGFTEDDRETLNSFEDEKLRKLHRKLVTNARPPMMEEEDEEVMEEEDEEEAPTGKKPMFFAKNKAGALKKLSANELQAELDRRNGKTTDNSGDEELATLLKNRSKPKTNEEWFASAPPDIQSAVRNAMSIEKREKAELIARLTDNVADEDMARVMNLLRGKPIPELRDLAAMIPAKAPQAMPSFLGASVPFTSNERAIDDDDTDVLPLPTINYKEEFQDRMSANTAARSKKASA